jgi:hypothetical protein
MLKLFLTIDAKQGHKIEINSETKVGGYYQTFGITALDENEMKTIIIEYLNKDLKSTLLEISESWTPDMKGRDKKLAKYIGNMDRHGIWYVSGRAWYPADE